MNGSTALFAYGTLQIAAVMETVTGRRFVGRPAMLEGYGRFRLRGCSYPGIVRQTGLSTPGTVFFGLDPASLRRIDAFEDDVYTRRPVVVRTSDGGRHLAQAYVVPRGMASLLSSQRWSVEEFRRLHLADFVARCRGFGNRYGRR